MGYFDRDVAARERPAATGEEIRAKIAENRSKRLAIAEAMKAEAGVEQHDINNSDDSGLAYFALQRIYSPLGLNRKQLITLAHECGHIFLHSAAPGIDLPSHVKEMEAECYAHQAFRAYGMTPPKWRTAWGRDYVMTWIERDRADGIEIDPRALSYAHGIMSPYQPLRFEPASWSGGEISARPIRIPIRAIAASAGIARWRQWLKRAGRILRFAGHKLFMGFVFSYFGLKFAHVGNPMPQYFEGEYANPNLKFLMLCLCLATIWMLIAAYLRVLIQPRLSAHEKR